MKKVAFLLIAVCASNLSLAQKKEFKVLAFSKIKYDFLSDIDVTSDWLNLNDDYLKNYQVVLWIDCFPTGKAEQAAFQKFVENGGGWIGIKNVFNPGWRWFHDFVGATASFNTSRPALPARLVLDKTHPLTQNVPAFITAPRNEWYQWKINPRENKNIQVIAGLDATNFPIGIDNIVTGGDVPVIWTNTRFNMVYLNLGIEAEAMSDWLQRRLFDDALMWVANKSVQKRKELLTDNSNMPEMISVQGGSFTMGDDAGDKDEKPAHDVMVSPFSIAKTETTIGQWRKFCMATGRKMPEDPWFKQSEQHPVINVSWDHAVAYCQWLSDVTGKHYRLPTEAEWEFAAKGGVKGRGFPYSGGKNPDSIAWLARKTDGTMPVAQKAPNELGLYDMTGNVWEWCSDWYAAEYYSTSVKQDPKGPTSGQFYTLRGGAWDIGARNNRVAYRNPLAPMSRNHNKGFRVVCDL